MFYCMWLLQPRCSTSTSDSLIHSIGMCKMWRLLAVLRSFFHFFYILHPSTTSNIHQLKVFWECFTGEVSLVRRVGAESRKSSVQVLQLKFYIPSVSKITIFMIHSLKTSLLLFLDFFFFFFLAICNRAAACKKKQAVTTPHINPILI